MRFDSWKAIAAYLGKDESTVRRWERELGLPVQRVQGAPGRSVFAYKEDLDAWLTRRQPALRESESVRIDPPPAGASLRWTAILWAGAVVMILGSLVAAVAWRRGGVSPVAAASFNAGALVGKDAAGVERWRVALSSDEQAEGLFGRTEPVELLPSGGALAGVGMWIRASDERLRSGGVFEVSRDGRIEHQFAFDDAIRFGAVTYRAPWILSDYRVSPPGAPRRIAVVAHHAQWWPSVLTILDDRWQRRGTFVNAGWIEHLYWLSPDRLLVSGYNEALDGGVVALFDAAAIDGQLRAEGADPKFDCDGCGGARPLRYLVMPRTEVNVATGSRFNRASVQVTDEGFVVRTIEVEQEGALAAADALYDFSADLTLRGVSFSSRYWDVHESLHRAGKLDHDRAHCPFRNGPAVVHFWDGASWRDVRPPAAAR